MSATGKMHELVVVGSGPAGVAAAVGAADAGLRVALVDEGTAAGGQVYRAPISGRAADSADGAAGNELRARLAASTVEAWFDTRVWHIEHGYRVSALGPKGPLSLCAPNVVVATGAAERHRPVPGWTLPGVLGLAGATNLIKAQKVLPGHRIAVAGSGPLLYLVAASIVEAGGDLAVVADARTRREWLGSFAAFLKRPDLAARGGRWLAKIRRSGAPVLYGHALTSIEGASSVEGVRAVQLGASGTGLMSDAATRHFSCDAVCYGFGLLPQVEATRLLGAHHVFDHVTQCWRPQSDTDGATSVPGLFVCGDGAGIMGAASALLQGEITGLAVARRAKGELSAVQDERLSRARRALTHARRFGAAMARLSAPPASIVELAAPDTIVCRCEGLTRAVLERGIDDGAVTINAIKATTRCGMGPCGGRVCEDAVASIIAGRTGATREAIGQSTARPPLRPMPLSGLAGAFDYDELPMPEPAPE